MKNIGVSISKAVVVLAAIMGLEAKGATVLEQLSNPVSDGSIVIDDSRDDWAGVQSYVADPNEGLQVDWSILSIANDTSTIYVRYQMNASYGFDGNLRLFLDTNDSRSSGYTGGENQLSIGAEYMIEGGTIYAFTGGSSTTWSWEWVGTGTYSVLTNDFEFSFSSSWIGSPETFGLVLMASSSVEGTEYRDYYTDSGNLGESGGYYTYSTVPEPGVTALFGLAAACFGVRALRRFRK